VGAQQELFAVAAEHAWPRRFYDFNVWTKQKRIEKLRYMRRNPFAPGAAIAVMLSEKRARCESISGGR
jgi:hypothetical protein